MMARNLWYRSRRMLDGTHAPVSLYEDYTGACGVASFME